MKIFRKIFETFRKRSLRVGYGCDACKAELFDYPIRRLCAACEEKLSPVKNPCPKCGREGISAGLCLDCKASTPSFTRGFSPFIYKGEGAVLINRLKNGNPRLAAYFGERMAENFLEKEEVGKAPLLIIAVPLTKEKRIERGYNQAELLAEGAYAKLKALGVDCELDFEGLQKTRETKPQKQMTRKERVENVKGAYALRRKKEYEDRIVLLVDDILTTGATGSECAKKLLKAGASAVYFLTATSLAEPK